MEDIKKRLDDLKANKKWFINFNMCVPPSFLISVTDLYITFIVI